MPSPSVTIGKNSVSLSEAKYDELLRKTIDFGGKHQVAKDLYSMGCPVVVNNGKILPEEGWVIAIETSMLQGGVTISWRAKQPQGTAGRAYKATELTGAEIADRLSRAYQKAKDASGQPMA